MIKFFLLRSPSDAEKITGGIEGASVVYDKSAECRPSDDLSLSVLLADSRSCGSMLPAGAIPYEIDGDHVIMDNGTSVSVYDWYTAPSV